MMAVDNGDRDVVDASLLRVPFESLKRAAKERKVLVDEAGEAVAGLSAVRGGELDALDALVARLQGLKRKLADVGRQEAEEAARCRARLAHLHAIGRPPRDGIIPWSKQRLDRILVDHMARSGHQASAGTC
jgi:macrophage erythroblast attacher